MPNPLPKDQYLFAKLDTEFRFVYVNRFFALLFGATSQRFTGKPLLNDNNAVRPFYIYERAIDEVKNRGFATCIVPHKGSQGQILWGCVDLSRRFGASANSGMIGYEFVSYPASQAAIDFFDPIYQELARLEQSNPSDPSCALHYFEESIAATGKPHDELVHTLQNA
ncbi:MAG: hypothetical protein AseanaTS_09640 [Candidatus Pelagadaptatus aseana]|uniref:hypothetical protein n=1 Tax=Candidatus Pelagadaptatus aseana TaxID=3120508 RepID=UPI0039B19AC4